MIRTLDLPIRGSGFKNNWKAPRSTPSFILLGLIKWRPEILGDLVVKSKLSPCSGSAGLWQMSPLHKKGPYICLSFFVNDLLYLIIYQIV